MNNLVKKTIAVAFLARGADYGWQSSCQRFLNSYKRHRAGIDHSLHIIFKGFSDASAMDEAKALFAGVPHLPILLGDDRLDIGAYIEWANQIDEQFICALNTTSEILADDWLQKLAANLSLPNIGLVGATASYESLRDLSHAFPKYPNVHIRSNAFMIDRKTFCRISEGVVIANKMEAFLFENGPESMTRKILASGHDILVVGRNGRGYSPQFWPMSNTFRQGTQSNLLVADNQTRNFMTKPWSEKQEAVFRTWGLYIREEEPRLADKFINPRGFMKMPA